MTQSVLELTDFERKPPLSNASYQTCSTYKQILPVTANISFHLNLSHNSYMRQRRSVKGLSLATYRDSSGPSYVPLERCSPPAAVCSCCCHHWTPLGPDTHSHQDRRFGTGPFPPSSPAQHRASMSPEAENRPERKRAREQERERETEKRRKDGWTSFNGTFIFLFVCF